MYPVSVPSVRSPVFSISYFEETHANQVLLIEAGGGGFSEAYIGDQCTPSINAAATSSVTPCMRAEVGPKDR